MTIYVDHSFASEGTPAVAKVTEGAVATHEPAGGWDNGATRFDPPTGVQGYASCSSIDLNTYISGGFSRLNVRYLMYIGSTLPDDVVSAKLFIAKRSGASPSASRLMIHASQTGGVEWNVASDNNIDGDTTPVWATTGYRGGWFCGEVEADIAAGTRKFRITTPDGVYNETLIQDAYLSRSIDFDAQTQNFSLNQVVTGQTSGATGYVLNQTDNGTTGTLNLRSISGTFQDNELVTGATDGSATVNGTLNFTYSTLFTELDVVGMFRNDNDPITYQANSYFKLDRLAIADQYIGPPSGFVTAGANTTISGRSRRGIASLMMM